MQDEFYTPAFLQHFYESTQALQRDLDKWPVHYNTERPHLGYRNMGRRPIDMINRFLSTMESDPPVRQEG